VRNAQCIARQRVAFRVRRSVLRGPYALTPRAGLDTQQLGALATLVVALGVHAGAYVAEIFRAGVNAVDKGQLAAAYAIGMSYGQALRRIILPQAVQKMIPPFINEFANLMKLTTLGSTIAFSELLHQSNNVIAQIYRPLEVYTALAVVFFILTYPVIYLSGLLEIRLRARQ